VTWNRQAAATAVAAALQATLGETVFVFPKPPQTVNPPAVIVGRPTEVRYSTVAFSIDEATIPVTCLGPLDGEDVVDGLIAMVRASFADRSLGGVVQACWAADERGWRNVNVAGVDVLVADVTLTIQM
jgi:hypothetical protein